jgi:hypothetical protein
MQTGVSCAHGKSRLCTKISVAGKREPKRIYSFMHRISPGYKRVFHKLSTKCGKHMFTAKKAHFSAFSTCFAHFCGKIKKEV